MRGIIIGTGHSTPEKILTNADLEKMVDISNGWITNRTGIKQRRIRKEGELTSDFCAKAAQQAIQEAQINANEIGLIIVATFSGDMRFPSTAIFVQSKIGAENAAAMDINAACSGFLYALSIADQYLRNEIYKYVLIIGSEMLSLVTDWKDRYTCVLFGDGAGAAVVTAGSVGKGILNVRTGANGSLSHLLYAKGMGTSSSPSVEKINNGDHFLKMSGNEVFLYAVQYMTDSANRSLNEAGLTINDIDLIIPHQANIRIIEAIRKKLGVSKDKMFVNIDKYGNTSAASIPIALSEAYKEGKIKEGKKVLMVAFGAGFTWASAIVAF